MTHPAFEHLERAASGEPLHASARVALHFHPDLLTERGPVLACIASDRRYRSQFETRVSNGGLTAFEGGARWQWESRIFGGHYDRCPAEERPKYGALDLAEDAHGPAPRFGSCFFRVRPEVLQRCSFCFPDSYYEPTCFGTARRMGLQALLEASPPEDPLDRYVEAHVHGVLSIPEDMQALVLDPSYRETEVERWALGLGCAVEWHPGYEVRVDVLRDNATYRGPEIVEVAERVASGELLTPRRLGEARRDPRFDAQQLKRVWHCLARFGRDWPTP